MGLVQLTLLNDLNMKIYIVINLVIYIILIHLTSSSWAHIHKKAIDNYKNYANKQFDDRNQIRGEYKMFYIISIRKFPQFLQ